MRAVEKHNAAQASTTNFKMGRNISSDEITEPILPTVGEGIEFHCKVFDEDHGPAVTAREPYNYTDEGLRKCEMRISSWVGVSIGANHHYVRITWYSSTVNNLDGTRHPKAGTSPNNAPDEADRTELEIRRPVTQRDIDYAKKRKDGWIPRSGDTERGFWSEQEAYDAGIKCFKEKFAPGWALFMHNDDGDLVEVARS